MFARTITPDCAVICAMHSLKAIQMKRCPAISTIRITEIQRKKHGEQRKSKLLYANHSLRYVIFTFLFPLALSLSLALILSCLFWFLQKCELYQNKSLFCFYFCWLGSNDPHVSQNVRKEKTKYTACFKCNVEGIRTFLIYIAIELVIFGDCYSYSEVFHRHARTFSREKTS